MKEKKPFKVTIDPEKETETEATVESLKEQEKLYKERNKRELTDEERNELIHLAADLGIARNVLFTGFIRGKKLRDIYSISDIFVMSSVSEPFGLTALEAAHHGDVLILTKQSGVSEIIWSAMKYDFWDEQKLADEILSVASNPALKETLRHNAIQEYRKISWNQVAKKCLKIYNKTMKHKGFN